MKVHMYILDVASIVSNANAWITD